MSYSKSSGTRLRDELTVPQLAAHAHMSPRTFARRFKAETGATPAAWLTRQRLLRAQALLEETDLPLDAVAAESGFGTTALLRHHFVASYKTTPTAYHRAFGARSAG